MKSYDLSFKTMGCPASFKFYASTPEQAHDVQLLILGELERLDSYYTNYSAHSYTAEINRTAGTKEGIVVDEETAGLLDYAHQCYLISDGLFDITAGVLYKAWDFTKKKSSMPNPTVISSLLNQVGWDKVRWNRPHLILPLPGMNLDFGGIVKEYAVDRIIALCHSHGISHGIIELGGDVGVIGPHPNGQPWHIGIQDPQNPDEALMTIALKKGSIASSGDYERYIEIDGVRHSHILNPLSGIPIKSVSAVTVVASHCLVAGSLTTISFLKEDQGIDWLEEQNVPYLFIKNNKKASCSKPLKDLITTTSPTHGLCSTLSSLPTCKSMLAKTEHERIRV